jgi:hypothetical protein
MLFPCEMVIVNETFKKKLKEYSVMSDTEDELESPFVASRQKSTENLLAKQDDDAIPWRIVITLGTLQFVEVRVKHLLFVVSHFFF